MYQKLILKNRSIKQFATKNDINYCFELTNCD